MGTLLQDMLKVADFSDVEFVRSPREGWVYYPKKRDDGKAIIFFPHLPGSENDAFRGALQAAHEVAHHWVMGFFVGLILKRCSLGPR